MKVDELASVAPRDTPIGPTQTGIRSEVQRASHGSSRSTSGTAHEAPVGGGAFVRLVRDGPVPRADCPHCGGRLELSTVHSRWKLHGPSDVIDRMMLQLGTLEREELHVLLLNTGNVVIDQQRVYQGNLAGSVVRVGELFTEAVRRGARSVLLVHNHPSGDATPSLDDVELTAETVAAGRLLDIEVLDHIVIAGGSFVSLRERGIAFDRPEGRHAGDGAGAYSTWNDDATSGTAPGVSQAQSTPRHGSVPGLRKVGRRLGRQLGESQAEAVGPGWLPCVCSHGRPVHLDDVESGPRGCGAEDCPCVAYEPSQSAPDALGASAYGRSWEPLRKAVPTATHPDHLHGLSGSTSDAPR